MTSSADRIAVDGHAHYYDTFAPQAFLDAARRHMQPRAGLGCLMLARSATARGAAALVARLPAGGAWRWEPTGEADSLLLHHRDGDRLVLIDGVQAVTAERLEVLAFGVDLPAGLPDGLPLLDAVARAADAGALVVLPWAFGKWRRLDEAMLAAAARRAPGRLWLGDNRGRPMPTPAPRAFAWAARLGLAVLPGSDPLPVAGQEAVVGAHGFLLPGSLDLDRPAAHLRDRLEGLPAAPEAYGQRVSWPDFCRDQWHLRSRRDAHAA